MKKNGIMLLVALLVLTLFTGCEGKSLHPKAESGSQTEGEQQIQAEMQSESGNQVESEYPTETKEQLDEEEQEREVFCVRSFGFDNQGLMEFYRKLRWIVPGRTRIIGTKTQEVWKLRRPNIGICTAAGMLLGYVLPKLLEMMYG